MLSALEPKATVKPMTRSEAGSRRKISLAIALILAFLVTLFYAVTIVRLKGNVANRAKLQSGGDVTKVAPVAPKDSKLAIDGKQSN